MKYSLVHILQRDRAATRIYSQGVCCKANPNLLSNDLARQYTFVPIEAATVYTIAFCGASKEFKAVHIVLLHTQSAANKGVGCKEYMCKYPQTSIKTPNPRCRLFLKLPTKGTWRQVFICLRPPIPPPRYTLYEYMYPCVLVHTGKG